MNFRKIIACVMGALCAVCCLDAGALAKDQPKVNPQVDWAAKMRALERTLGELLIDVSSDTRFNSAKNKSRIENNAKKLAQLAHGIDQMKGESPDPDPTVRIVAGLFAQEAEHAYQSLKTGRRTYARGVLRSISSYCLSCHTRNSAGPQFQGMWSSVDTSSLTPLERGNYLAATRKFDQALEEYLKVVNNASVAKKVPFEWERAVRLALAIQVRVKQDPEVALALSRQVQKTPTAPYYLQEQAKGWEKSLLEWKNQPKRTPVTEAGLLSEAQQLISEASKKMQEYPADRSADVLYLRATALLHELLSKSPDGPQSAEALYLSGVCYEVLQGLNLWDLHEFYYLSCIQRVPHTSLARRCFRNYQQSVYASYTGSSGTSLPSDVLNRLKELDQLSGPAQSPTPVPLQ